MFATFLKRMKGRETSPPRRAWRDIIWSLLGSFLGIFLIAKFNGLIFSNITNNLLLVGSFGASAVLVYAAPQAEFSQPRNLIGGHIFSALVGISVYKFLAFDVTILAAIAVSVAIGVMHLTRTLHPPGGATALIAVIGSSEVHQLGYLFVLYPVASGAMILLVIALLVNNLSSDPNRHYPKCWL